MDFWNLHFAAFRACIIDSDAHCTEKMVAPENNIRQRARKVRRNGQVNLSDKSKNVGSAHYSYSIKPRRDYRYKMNKRSWI